MARYIDAEKIEIRVPYGYNNDGELLIPLAAVKQSIAQTPTEDVAEIVRCVDCEKYDGIGCPFFDGIHKHDDDFCS